VHERDIFSQLCESARDIFDSTILVDYMLAKMTAIRHGYARVSKTNGAQPGIDAGVGLLRAIAAGPGGKRMRATTRTSGAGKRDAASRRIRIFATRGRRRAITKYLMRRGWRMLLIERQPRYVDAIFRARVLVR